jgi:hypothetical protein
MRPADDIKRLIARSQIESSPQVDRRILADTLEDLERRRADRLTRRPGVWRIVMKTRTAKLAAAAVVVAAILISVPHFNDTTVKAVEFEEIAQAVQHVLWMHMTATGFDHQTGGLAEHWVGFEARIQATKMAKGNALFISEKDHQQFEYDPDSRTITVRYLESLPVDIVSPAGVLTTMHKLLEQRGVQIVVKMGVNQGRKVQIQEITSSNVGGQGGTESLTLYIDPDAKLLYGAEGKALDAAGKVITAGTFTFDYPSSGPQSIYDLGVPRDARIVGNGPEGGIQAVLDQYQRVRAEATKEYIALIANYESIQSESIVTIVDVDYKWGRQHRQERHDVFHKGEAFVELWPTYREQLGDSFDSLLMWTRRHCDDPLARLDVRLHDGQYSCSVRRDGEQGWGKRNQRYDPGGDIGTMTSLANQAWPAIDPTARIIEDDYARENGWVCIETLSQGLITPGGWASPPGRFLSYLDPSRDYLCRRQVRESRHDAAWQKDKDWLAGVDPQKIMEDSTTIIDIAEAVQAPNGHRYPQAIVESYSGQAKDRQGRAIPYTRTVTKRVYVQVSPTFPDGIFDIEKLPGQ